VPRAFALERQLASLSAGKGKRVPEDMPREGMRFEAVEFRYPGLDRAVLSGLDLDIPAGRSLAIVGENGAGKTTLVKLICRLYEPTGGSIGVDGAALAEFDPIEWHGRVAAIFQDFARYHMSARDNVAMGAPGHAGNAEKLRAAASRAGALDLIESLPRGWDTVLSREYAGGVDLSGGQWQRIALARAMFAVEAGARVLILDEPTASLDVRAEAELYDRFLEITEGLTTILISHRFSTVRRADRIVVLEGGRVAEAGSHEELMSEGGRYAAMFRVQAERFVEGVSA
jgi:ATP-binding cassette subfamily B protein